MKDNNIIFNSEIITTKPKHIAFILDGNRRWAKQNSVSVNKGHKAGAKNIENLCNWCIKYGIPYLTLYCLSIENLKRTKQELNYLFQAIKQFLSQKQIENYQKHGIKLQVIGDNNYLPQNVSNTIKMANIFNEKNNTIPKLNLQLCIGYSGKNEIINAVKQIILSKKQQNEINEETFEKYLFTSELPDVDLLIRTGGDQRVSNFLMWKSAYAELYFCKKYFPIFMEEDFLLALYEFNNRLRRYGR